jgi:hypothetical protein
MTLHSETRPPPAGRNGNYKKQVSAGPTAPNERPLWRLLLRRGEALQWAHPSHSSRAGPQGTQQTKQVTISLDYTAFEAQCTWLECLFIIIIIIIY